MAWSLAAGDPFQFRMLCKAADQISVNVLHAKVTAVGTPFVTDQDFCDAFSLGMSTIYLPMINVNAIYYGAIMSLRVGSTWMQVATSREGTDVGDGTGDLLPRQSAAILTLTTGTPGRSNRGRVYVPFPGEGFCNVDGHPNSTLTGAMSILGSAMRGPTPVNAPNPINGAMTFTGQIFHRGNPGTYTPVTGFVPRARFGNQRRRGDYGKPNTPPF